MCDSNFKGIDFQISQHINIVLKTLQICVKRNKRRQSFTASGVHLFWKLQGYVLIYTYFTSR